MNDGAAFGAREERDERESSNSDMRTSMPRFGPSLFDEFPLSVSYVESDGEDEVFALNKINALEIDYEKVAAALSTMTLAECLELSDTEAGTIGVHAVPLTENHPADLDVLDETPPTAPSGIDQVESCTNDPQPAELESKIDPVGTVDEEKIDEDWLDDLLGI